MRRVPIWGGFAAAVLLWTTAAPAASTYSDNLSTLNPSWWSASTAGGDTISNVNNRTEMTQSSNPAGQISLSFFPLLRGNYSATVDYQLLNWPANNDERDYLGASTAGGVGRISDSQVVSGGGEGYVVDFRQVPGGALGVVPTSDTSGTLKVQRISGVTTGYFWTGSGWQTIPVPTSTGTADTLVGMGFSTFTHPTAGVRVAFDNFSVTADQFIDPGTGGVITPEPATLALLALGGLALIRRRRHAS